MNISNRNHPFLVEGLLGLAIGTGCMTSLRLGLVGISEVLFAVFAIVNIPLLLSNNIAKNLLHGTALLYMFLTVFLILPIVSISVFYLADLNSNLAYIFSFWLAFIILFIVHKLFFLGQLNLPLVSFIATILFLTLNILAFVMNPPSIGERFLGFSNNPNQVMFFASTLILLSSMFLSGTRKVLLILGCICIGLLSLSDAFGLFIFCSATIWFYLKVFLMKSKAIGIRAKILISLVPLIIFIPVAHSMGLIEILNLLWLESDEGNTRTSLMRNGFLVTFDYPFFGLGVGSFSGEHGLYGGREAHNTFIDLSMQFGIFFAAFVYFVFARSVLVLLRSREIFTASTLVAFIIVSQFHFFGRHVIFWILFAILFSIQFFPKIIEVRS